MRHAQTVPQQYNSDTKTDKRPGRNTTDVFKGMMLHLSAKAIVLCKRTIRLLFNSPLNYKTPKSTVWNLESDDVDGPGFDTCEPGSLDFRSRGHLSWVFGSPRSLGWALVLPLSSLLLRGVTEPF